MDYTISNNSKLFDDLLNVLNAHQKDTGALEALADLKAAKLNYTQRSIDHMLNCILLAAYDLSKAPNGQEVFKEMLAVIQTYVRDIFDAGSRLTELARRYQASGGKLLADEEILQEVDERRGSSH